MVRTRLATLLRYRYITGNITTTVIVMSLSAQTLTGYTETKYYIIIYKVKQKYQEPS